MGEPYLTMAEIEAKYPNEWVFLDHLKVNRHQQVLGGVVVAHSTDRGEMDRRMIAHPGNSMVTVHYTGQIDPDEALLLHLDL